MTCAMCLDLGEQLCRLSPSEVKGSESEWVEGYVTWAEAGGYFSSANEAC